MLVLGFWDSPGLHSLHFYWPSQIVCSHIPAACSCQLGRLLLRASFVRFKQLPILPLKRWNKSHLGVSWQDEWAAPFKALRKAFNRGFKAGRSSPCDSGLKMLSSALNLKKSGRYSHCVREIKGFSFCLWKIFAQLSKVTNLASLAGNWPAQSFLRTLFC